MQTPALHPRPTPASDISPDGSDQLRRTGRDGTQGLDTDRPATRHGGRAGGEEAPAAAGGRC